MAVREMFELKAPKRVNKESLTNLIIKALEKKEWINRGEEQ